MPSPKDKKERVLWKGRIRKARIGTHRSKKTKEKMSESLKGKITSEATKKKIRKAKKGTCIGEQNHMFGKHHTFEGKNKMRQAHLGLLAGERNPNWGKRGAETSNWKGGKVSLICRVRSSFQYRLWRSDVLTRDDFTCQECGRRGGALHAHHAPDSFAFIMELNDIRTYQQAMDCSELWNINDGITYCKKCHKEYHRLERRKEHVQVYS